MSPLNSDTARKNARATELHEVFRGDRDRTERPCRSPDSRKRSVSPYQ